MAKSIVEIQGQSEILDSTFSLQNLLNIPGAFPVQSSAIAPETQASLDEAITLAKQYLHNAASRDDFDELLITTFGDRYNPQIAENLRQNFIDGNIENLFQLSNLADDILGDAQGAFAQETNTIYLADSLLNSHNVEQITNVFLEEFIHGIDSLINPIDAQGDEGDIGSRLIRNETITSDELALLKQENDQATIFLDGQAIAIEQALPTLTLSVIDGTAAETNVGQVANSGGFRFTRTGSTATALTVYYNIAGTAIKGTDYNNLTGSVVIPIGATFVNLAIAPINDAAYEGTEKVILSLKTSSAYVLGAAQIGTVNILDNDLPTISITANDSNAAEVSSGRTQNSGQFTLTRTGNTASALTVSYTMSGTATKGTDYNNLTGTVSFAAGSAIAIVNVNVINDSIFEYNETVVLNLSANTAYSLNTIKSATVTIANRRAVQNDFNGDGTSDILWRNTLTGVNEIWKINPLSMTLENRFYLPQFGNVSSGDQIVGVGDFNGDGTSDILWRNTVNGANEIWRINPLTMNLQAQYYLPAIATNLGYQIEGVGDFNGDGVSDILWRNTVTGANEIWKINPLSMTLENHFYLPTIAANSGYQIKGVGDFNGDGTSDILWRNNITGANEIWRINPLTMNLQSQYYLPTIATNSGYQIKGVGDFNGDGTSDILWRNITTGDNEIWKINPLSMTLENHFYLPKFGSASSGDSIAGVGDFNGDGTSDILWRNTVNGANEMWRINPQTMYLQAQYYLPSINGNTGYKIATDFAPDLIIKNQYAPSSANVGSNITVSANTINIGSGASVASNIRYWLSNDTTFDRNTDIWLGDQYVDGLGVGASQYDSLTFNYNSAWGTGTKYIFFEADGYNHVAGELNESNNLAYQAISISSITPPSGLMATSTRLSELQSGSLIGTYIEYDGAYLNQCVDLTKYAIDQNIQTSYWKRGANVIANGNVAIGTAIATFSGPNNSYNGGTYQHTGIFAGYGYENGVYGFYMWEQNSPEGSPIRKGFRRIDQFNALDADNYYVIQA